MNTIKNYFKSEADRIRNANKARLSPTARQIYLLKYASLGNAEKLAEGGFRVPTSYLEPKEFKHKS